MMLKVICVCVQYFLVINVVATCLASANLNSDGRLIQNDWETLEQNSRIRYFNPDRYYPGGSPSEIWDMGQDIPCSVHDDLTTTVQLPAGYRSDLPVKLVTHGYITTVIGTGDSNYVNAWMQTYNKQVNVIMVDWSPLAFAITSPDWSSVFYDAAALNAIDVGEYLGHCLAALATQTPDSKLHLIGHSLGAHLVGKAGRTFQEVTGESVSRITGLDPAGPRFVDGPIMSAIPELYENRLNPESADYVDVIHTCASLTPAAVWFEPRLGDLHQLGHVDFYPQGGSAQTGCQFGGPDALPGGSCSHDRAIYFYLHSIFEPELFPSLECSDVEACSNFEVESFEVRSYMGEQSQNYWTPGERKLYFIDIKSNHWDYYEHN